MSGIMPKPRDEVGKIPSKKPLDKEESVIMDFLEKRYDLAYTEEDLIKELPEIDKTLIPIRLELLSLNEIIDVKIEKDYRGRLTRYYMARKRYRE
jgi:hypothetical protein